MKFFTILLILILKESVSYVLFPDSELSVKEGDGFVTFLKPDKDETNSDITICDLKTPDGKTWNLIINEKQVHNHDENVKLLEEHICGARVDNVNDSFAGYWNVNVKYKNKRTQGFGFKLNVLKPNTFNITRDIAGTPGHRVTFTCGEKYNENICEIRDLQRRQTERVCNKTVYYPDSGITDKYLCLIKKHRSMELAQETILIRGKTDDELRNGDIYTTNESATLTCNFPGSISNCLAVHLKSQKILNIENYLEGPRYNSKNTKLEKGVCQLEIPKPFLEDEIGTWKIVTRRSVNGYEVEHGCFFNVGSDGSEELNDLKNRVAIKQELFAESDSITIKCEEAPYPLKYCYLVSQTNETIFKDNDDIFQYTSTTGSCIFYNVGLPFNKDLSNWKCGFNTPDEKEEDIIQDIEVKGPDYFINIFQKNKVILKETNNNITFLCQSPLGIPIKTCMFKSPENELFLMTSTTYQNEEHEYFGKGFENGDCGIAFLNFAKDSFSFGYWKCIIIADPRATVQHLTRFEKVFRVLRYGFYY